MAPPVYVEFQAVIDDRPAIAAFPRQFGERRRDVESGQRRRRLGDGLGAALHLAHQVFEQFELESHRPLGGARDAPLQLAEFDGGVAHGVGHGLTVDKGGVGVGRHARRLLGRHFDKIAKHVVVADLELLDIGLGGVAALQPGDQALAFVAKGAQLVELGCVAGGDEAAVACIKGQFGAKRTAQAIDDVAVMAEAGGGVRNAVRW